MLNIINQLQLIKYYQNPFISQQQSQQQQPKTNTQIPSPIPHPSPIKMSSKMKVIFQINTNQGSRIKQIAMHRVKDWVGIINQNNTFSLWNFQQKILIKSFSCNTLDDNKIVQIRQIVFFDKHSLCTIQQCKNMKNNIIFVTNAKLIFYDYITDAIKQTSQKDFDQKSIRKVCVYSQNKICIAMSDGSFKVLDTKDAQSKGSMTIRTVKGYHVKPIAWIFAYSQNYNQMPRVITASDQDGMMACWNIDMILKSPANVQFSTPCFRFTSSTSKKTKQSISNQQILSLQYDPSSYRMITINQQWIRLWSTMTGIQVKRIKNTYKYRQIIFFNHFTYTSQSFVAHSKTSKLMVIRNSNGLISINNQIQLRNFFPGNYSNNPQQQMQISQIYSLPHHPANLFLVTNFNMAILQVDKFYMVPFGYHNSFFTKFSTINSRDLINRTQGQIRKNITANQIYTLKFQQQILINTFFLSVDEQAIYFNLIQIQYTSMLHQTRKYKIHTLQQTSPLKYSQGGRSIILINFQGNQIIIYNKLLCYYQIYASYNEHEGSDLLNHNDIQNRIDFYSKFVLVGSGYCRDICYHQFKHQYAIIAGYDDKDRLVQYRINKQKKGIFKGKQSQIKLGLSAQPVKFKLHIYQRKGKQYTLVQKSQFYLSKLYKIYNFGSFYGYSITKGTYQLMQIICSDKNSTRQIDGILNCAQQVYISYCQSYYVLSYDRYFIVFKVQENGSMSYFRTFEYTLLHGYFWQKFFFFLTQSSLYFLHILNDDSIMIKIADISKINIIQKVIDDIQDDDLQPQCQLLPAGQQQIIGLVNMSLVLLNQIGNPTLINLDGFPYVVFCLEIASGVVDQSTYLYKNASKNICNMMKETLTNYGMIAPDLMG